MKRFFSAAWILALATAAQAGIAVHDPSDILGYTDAFLGYDPFESAFSCGDRMDVAYRTCYSGGGCNGEVDRVAVVSCSPDRVIVQTIRPNGEYRNNAVYRGDYEVGGGNILRWSVQQDALGLLSRSEQGAFAPLAGQVTDAYFDRVDPLEVRLRDGKVIDALRVGMRLRVWDRQTGRAYIFPLDVTVGANVPAIVQQLSARHAGSSQPEYEVLAYDR